MTVARKPHGQPVLILGAGRGGTAMLEMFLDDDLVAVIGIADVRGDAPGMVVARKHDIPAYVDLTVALQACNAFPDCIVYNLTHDDSIVANICQTLGRTNASSGVEAKLIWQMVTKLKRVKEELELSQSQLKAIFENAMDGIIIIDEFGVIQGFNPAAEQVFNYKKEEVLGKNVTLLMPDAHRNKHDMAISEYLQTGANDAQSVKARERTALRKGGDIFPIELSASEMRLNGGRFFIGLVRDITERKRDNLRIEQLAHLDFLTRLPNRALFKDRLERAIAMAERNCTKLAVLFLDLDGFKNINDVLGHEAGDQLLCEVASRLTEAVRHADTVARIGGDEFTLILNDVDGCEGAAQVATKILQVLGGTFVIAEQCRQVGASIGISIYPDDARDYDDLLRIADGHMYLAKQQGKNTFRFRPLIAPGSGSAKDGCT